MNRFFSLAGAGLAAAGFLLAQTPEIPTFDAASIKASDNSARAGQRLGGTGNIHTSQVSLNLTNVNFKSAVAWAYHVLPPQVTGPDWMEFERFDIVAKSVSPTDSDTMRLMLRGLLASRFHLEAHRETKEMGVYVLSQAKGGVKLQESAAEGDASIEPDQKTMSVVVQHTPVSQLIELLVQFFRAPVLDETGLKGKYDIKLDIAKYVAGAGPGVDMDPQTMIVQILQNELGLKLEPKKASVELVVVDKADKAPSEN